MSNIQADREPLLSLATSQLAPLEASGVVTLHWYDLTCPFCYVGQQRTDFLVEQGVTVVGLPFQAHPEIPPDGMHMGVRTGPMYEVIEREAALSRLPLKWQPRLPNSRQALAAAEWTRQHQSQAFVPFVRSLFHAHFAAGLDIGSAAVIEQLASTQEIDITRLRAAWGDGSAVGLVAQGEDLGRRFGVAGTPAWALAGRLISGLRPIAEFKTLASQASRRIS